MNLENTELLRSIKSIILEARQRVFRTTNTLLLQTYWNIGKLIVEEEQKGRTKADYGKSTLKNLAQQLTLEFGKGFDYTNLTNMRKFFMSFPIIDTLRQELSWSHYRLLSRLDTAKKKITILTRRLLLDLPYMSGKLLVIRILVYGSNCIQWY
jgi:DUF1016 N-terminal domain